MKLTSEQIEDIKDRQERKLPQPPFYKTDDYCGPCLSLTDDIPALLSHIKAVEAERDEADSVGYGKGYQDGYQKGFDDGCEEE